MIIGSPSSSLYTRPSATFQQPQAAGFSGSQDGFVSGPRTLVEPPPPGYNPNAPLPREWTITAAGLSGGLLGGIAGAALTHSGLGAAALAIAGGAGAAYAAFRATAE